MRGILSHGCYLPYRRLDLASVAVVAGAGGRKGTRTVASFDEDSTTMAVEAARVALGAAGGAGASVGSLWFSTVSPPYLDRTNATAIHAALRLDRQAPSYDVVGSVRSSLGALRAALAQPGTALAVASDVRVGLPGGADESYFGDGAAALLVGDEGAAPVIAEVAAWVSISDEFVERWRTPGDVRSKTWEERFGELRYSGLANDGFDSLLKEAGIAAGDVDHLVLAGTHARALRTAKASLTKAGVAAEKIIDDLTSVVGNTGAAHPLLLISAALERARSGQTIVVLSLADGADALLLRTTDAIATAGRATPSLAEQVGAGGPIAYGRYLAWRGLLPIEPPRRPEPARVSSSAAGRSVDWKFGFVGSRSDSGEVHLPPLAGSAPEVPMAGAQGTVTTFTIDRLSYTPSPPMVFVVVDFDGGGRIPVELTDVDAADVKVGDRVEMTFRRLASADGIHNYFWKARPVRHAPAGLAPSEGGKA